MSRKATPWSARIFEMLADGPVEREHLIQETLGLVPPGRAHRRCELNRKNIARYQGRKFTPRAPDDSTFRIGARHIIAMSIAQFVRSGRLIKEGTTYRIGRAEEYDIEKLQRWQDALSDEDREAYRNRLAKWWADASPSKKEAVREARRRGYAEWRAKRDESQR